MGHIVKIDGNGLLFKEIDALDADLQVLSSRCRNVLSLFMCFLALCLHLCAVNAASLVWFIDLRFHDLFKTGVLLHWIIALLVQVQKLLHLVVFIVDLDGLEKPQLSDPGAAFLLSLDR